MADDRGLIVEEIDSEKEIDALKNASSRNIAPNEPGLDNSDEFRDLDAESRIKPRGHQEHCKASNDNEAAKQAANKNPNTVTG